LRREGIPVPIHTNRPVQALWITGLNHVFLQDLAGFCPMTSVSRSPECLDCYTRGLEVSIELVRVDPKNTYFQQSIAIAYSNTAHAMSETSRNAQSLDYMEKGLQIMRDLVASAPENRQQRWRSATRPGSRAACSCARSPLQSSVRPIRLAGRATSFRLGLQILYNPLS
jgi:hypothetical protein